MSSVLDSPANFASEERVPQTKRIRKQVASTPQKKTFSDRTNQFSGVGERRLDRYQKDYVGVYTGSNTPGGVHINKPPLSYQTEKYEDDNTRFLATGDRLRAYNPSDRRRPTFSTATERINRLNVYPDGTPRNGVAAELSNQQNQNEELKTLFSNINNLPANLAAAFAAALPRSSIPPPGPAYIRTPGKPVESIHGTASEASFGNLSGLFGSDVKTIEDNAITISSNAAAQRINELESIRSSSEFKTKADELARKLGVRININEPRNDLLDGLKQRWQVIQDDRNKAKALEALNRRGSVDSNASENKSEASGGSGAPASGAVSLPANPTLANAIINIEDLKSAVMSGQISDVRDQPAVQQLGKIILQDTSLGLPATSDQELSKYNAKQWAVAITTRINAIKSIQAMASKIPSPKGLPALPTSPPVSKAASPTKKVAKPPSPSAAASTPAPDETKIDEARINSIITNLGKNKLPNKIDKAYIAGLIGKDTQYVDDTLGFAAGPEQIMKDLNDLLPSAASTISTAMQNLLNFYGDVPDQVDDYADKTSQGKIKTAYSRYNDFWTEKGLTPAEIVEAKDKFENTFKQPNATAKKSSEYHSKIGYLFKYYEVEDKLPKKGTLDMVKNWTDGQLTNGFAELAQKESLKKAKS